MDAGSLLMLSADSSAKDGKHKLQILARKGDGISHWHFGSVVHDMTSMKMHREKITLDYVHDSGEVIGYIDQFDIIDGDLHCYGYLTPFTASDRASEVYAKLKAGVPYEASIDFSDGGYKTRSAAPGEEINGRKMAGGETVIYDWTLRALAVCPYGADSGTKTEALAADGGALAELQTKLAKAETDAQDAAAKLATATETITKQSAELDALKKDNADMKERLNSSHQPPAPVVHSSSSKDERGEKLKMFPSLA